jgi:predicted amidohydrolase
MRIALVQLDVDLDRDLAASRDLAVGKVHEAAEDGAELVLLPELWLNGAFDPEPWARTAEPLHGETAQMLREAAVDCGIVLHGGSIVERTPDGNLYNTSLVFDAEGELLAGYRKIHGFGFDQGEAAVMTQGEHLAAWRRATTCVFLSSTAACSERARRPSCRSRHGRPGAWSTGARCAEPAR